MFKVLIVVGWTIFAVDAVLAVTAMVSRDMGDDAAGRGVAFTYGLIGLAFVLGGGAALFFSGRAHSWVGAGLSILPLALPLLIFFGTDLESYAHSVATSFGRRKEGRYPEPAQRELYKAIQTGDYLAMRKLLASHPNLSGRDEAGDDLLALAVRQTHLVRGQTGGLAAEDAENLKCVEGVRLLLEAGMDPNQSKGMDDSSTFVSSAYNVARPTGHGWQADPAGAEVFRMLLDHGANPNMLKEGEPLIFSVRNNPDSMRALLDHGADINGRDAGGNTPLLFYLRNGFWDAALVVLDRGANVHVQNNSAVTPEAALDEAKAMTERMGNPLPEGYHAVKAALDRRLHAP